MQGRVALGAIMLYRREVDPFDDDDVALVETFAAQAVIAIENVRSVPRAAVPAGARSSDAGDPGGHKPVA